MEKAACALILMFTLVTLLSPARADEKTQNCASQDCVEKNNGIPAKLPMGPDGITRLSRIEVYPEHLKEYKKFATEVGAESLQREPGVLAMHAMAERENPCKITILEIYASQDAYKAHIASPHFRKYKEGTLKMVKSLRLVDQKPLNSASKLQNFIQEGKDN